LAPENGNFTAYGANNAYLIGTVQIDSLQACQDFEFSYVSDSSFGSTNNQFQIDVWNAENDCDTPWTGNGCPSSSDPNCIPCSGPLCDGICEPVVEEFTTGGSGGSKILYSNQTDNTISAITANQNTVSTDPTDCPGFNHNYVIQEDLLVDTDWCHSMAIAGPAEGVVFMEGRKIVIPSGVTARFEGIQFESCSDIFWDAIEVQKGGTLLMTDCDIKDGRNAIRAENGANLNIQNCNFTDNYVGIYMEGIDDFNNNEAINLTLRGNNFSGTGQLAAAYSGQSPMPSDLPFAGIQLQKVKFVDLSSFGDNATNYFDNMYNGIVSSASSFVIGGAQFSNMIRPNDTNGISGYGIFASNRGRLYNYMQLQPSLTESLFTNMPVGISMRNMAANIDEAIMQNIDTGVEVQNCKQKSVIIKNSNIQANNFGIVTVNNSPLFGKITDNFINVNSANLNSTESTESAGIACYENNNKFGPGWNISNNDVHIVSADEAIVYKHGDNANISDNRLLKIASGKNEFTTLKVVNSDNTTLRCNIIASTAQPNFGFTETIGIDIDASPNMAITCNVVADLENGVIFNDPCAGADFKANTMSDGAIGLILTESAVISPQDHKGNCFDDNLAAEASHNATEVAIVEASAFEVKCEQEQNGPSCICPDLTEIDVETNAGILPEDFFAHEFLGQTATCEEEEGSCLATGGFSPPNEPNDDVSRNVAVGTPVYGIRNPQYERMLQYDLFASLDRLEDPIQDPRLNTFYQNNLQSNLGNIHAANGTFLTVHNQEILMDELDLELANLSALELSWYNQDISEATYNQEKMNLYAQIAMVKNKLNSAYNTYNQSLIQEIGDQKAALSNVTSSQVYDVKMKWILRKDLLAREPDFVDFTEVEWSAIYNLAMECAKDAGHAVFIARSLYNTKELTDFESLQSCNGIQARRGKEEGLISDGFIFPNPSSGLINISWKKTLAAELQIFNFQGGHIFTTVLQKGKNSVDLSNFPAGVYFFTMAQNGEVIQNGKLMLFDK